MHLNQDYTTNFRDYGEITVPKGTKVTHYTATGFDPLYHFVNDTSWVKEKYPTIDRLLIHDLTYYGMNVPVEYVEKTPDEDEIPAGMGRPTNKW